VKSAMQVASCDASSGQLHFGPIGFVIYALGRERRVHCIYIGPNQHGCIGCSVVALLPMVTTIGLDRLIN
jgi:hypothetical protein